MIYESYLYREELHRIATRLEKRKTYKRWTDHSLFLLEKDVFIAFYLIRKLFEPKTKVSTSLPSKKFSLIKYASTGEKPNIRNNHKIDRLYVMDKPHFITKPFGYICNQFVHSYICVPYIVDQPLSLGILFNSFEEREKGLYHLSATELATMIRLVADDHPTGTMAVYNFETEDYDCWAGSASDMPSNMFEEFDVLKGLPLPKK